jgi:flavin reductase (DIM6/NTAB) family NADH-FMN oxidoreductase RutF
MMGRVESGHGKRKKRRVKMKRSIGARTLLLPTPVLLVGTYDGEGRANVMTVAWGGICCSQPPCVGISIRKATYTYGNIVQRGAFTVGIASESQVKEVDYFGIESGRRQDKVGRAGFTPVKSDLVDAPYFEEFHLVFECKVLHAIELGLHTQFIGEILDTKASEVVINEKGLPDMELLKPIVYAPEIRYYYGVGRKLGRAFAMGKEISGAE